MSSLGRYRQLLTVRNVVLFVAIVQLLIWRFDISVLTRLDGPWALSSPVSVVALLLGAVALMATRRWQRSQSNSRLRGSRPTASVEPGPADADDEGDAGPADRAPALTVDDWNRWSVLAAGSAAALIALATVMLANARSGFGAGILAMLGSAIAAAPPERAHDFGMVAPLGFLLLGFSLLFSIRPTYRAAFSAQLLGVATTLVAVFAITARLYGATSLDGYNHHSLTTYPTSIGLLLLGIGVGALRSRDVFLGLPVTHFSTRRIMRWWIVSIVGVPVGVGWAAHWFRVNEGLSEPMMFTVTALGSALSLVPLLWLLARHLIQVEAAMTESLLDLARANEEMAHLNAELEAMSIQDGLTGVANRRHFDAMLATEWARLARAEAPLSLLMIDIDFFKAYNDRYGHLSGDECLKKVAFRLSKRLQRASDLVARYGGEEFAVILPETEHGQASHIAERLRQSVLDLAIEHGASQIAPVVTVSIGVATSHPTRDTFPTALIKAADDALYQAKQQGRNRVIG